MHELYYAPKGHWENIYHNFKPIGLGKVFCESRCLYNWLVGRNLADCGGVGQAKLVVTDPGKKEEEGGLVSPLVKADGMVWRSSRSRLGVFEGMGEVKG